MKNNFFYNLLKEENKIGGQNKIKRLYNDRNFIEFLLSKLKQTKTNSEFFLYQEFQIQRQFFVMKMDITLSIKVTGMVLTILIMNGTVKE